MKKSFAIAGILAVSLCAFGVAACGEEGGGGQAELRAEVTDAEWTTAFDLKTTNCTIKVTSHAEGETEEGLDSYVDYTMYILESGEMQTVTVNEGKTQKAYSVSEGGKNYCYRYYSDSWHKSESEDLFIDDTGIYDAYIAALADRKSAFAYSAEHKNYSGKIEFDMPGYDVSVTVSFEEGKLISEQMTVVGNEDGEEITVYYEITVTAYGATSYTLPDFGM